MNSCAVVHPDIRPKMIMTIRIKRPTATATSMAKTPKIVRRRKMIFFVISTCIYRLGVQGARAPCSKNLLQIRIFAFIDCCHYSHRVEMPYFGSIKRQSFKQAERVVDGLSPSGAIVPEHHRQTLFSGESYQVSCFNLFTHS